MNLPLELAVLVAVAISLVGTFLARHAAVRLDWLDQPSHRKVHANPIPLLGGIAMYMAFLVSILVTNSRTVLEEGTAVVIGATLLLVVGVIDDQRGLRPLTKLLAQAVAAVILVIGGIGVEFFPFGWLNLAATVLWVAAICNAMNLLDNMDGLSAGVAAIACAFFTLLAVWHGQIWVSVVAAVVLGATLGFLRFNWNPATTFMGDAGSLLLGFLLAVLAIKLRFPEVDPRRTWPIPILILAVPIFDTTLVTLSRLRRGIPISSGGRDHLSHRLVHLGLSVRQAVGTIYIIALLCGAAAVATLLVPSYEHVYLGLAAFTVAGIAALVRLEQVDLADTGQVAHGHRPRRLTRVLRPARARGISLAMRSGSRPRLRRAQSGQASAARTDWRGQPGSTASESTAAQSASTTDAAGDRDAANEQQAATHVEAPA